MAYHHKRCQVKGRAIADRPEETEDVCIHVVSKEDIDKHLVVKRVRRRRGDRGLDGILCVGIAHLTSEELHTLDERC